MGDTVGDTDAEAGEGETVRDMVTVIDDESVGVVVREGAALSDPVAVGEGDTVWVGVREVVTDAGGVTLRVTVMDSVVGAFTVPLLTPFPSCPYVSSPQQEMAPPAVSAHV